MRKHEMDCFRPYQRAYPWARSKHMGYFSLMSTSWGKSSVVHTVVSTSFETERLLIYVLVAAIDSQEQQPL